MAKTVNAVHSAVSAEATETASTEVSTVASAAAMVKAENAVHSTMANAEAMVAVSTEVSITENFDITELNKFIENHNKKSDIQIKLFHCICYAIARTIFHRPKILNMRHAHYLPKEAYFYYGRYPQYL